MVLSQPASVANPQHGATERSIPLPLAVLVAALLALAGGAVLPSERLSLAVTMTGSILFATAIILTGLGLRRAAQRRTLIRAVSGFIENDVWPSFITDAEGGVLHRNKAADDRFMSRKFDTLAGAFADLFANPGAILFRLQGRALALGIAREDVVTRRGHLRVSVHRVEDSTFLWRIEEMGERAAVGRGADALSLPMLTAGPSGTILYMNDAFRKLTGGRARALDRVFRDLPLVSGQVHQVEGTDGIVHCLVAEVPGNGGRREVYLLPADASGRNRSVAPGWDAVEELPVPLLKVSPGGEVLSANREARTLLPMPIGRGTRLSDLLEGLGRPVIDWLADAAAGRATGPQFLRGTGAHQTTFLRVQLNPAGSGDDLHLVAVLNDVTELKSLEAQFVQSQKMQAIGQLAGGVAHDFNNLLTAISGHCDLLLLRHDQGDLDYADLIQIHQNANRAASLVGQLLAFSRKQSLMPEVLDMRDTLADLTHLLNRLVGERVTLSLNHDPAILPIRADKRQLEQVLMNLVVNARDAMPEGGEIWVETENLILSEPLERNRATVPAGSYVVVRVIDQGIGIEPDKLPKIFEPFYTTKRPGEGTGLGLSTAYGIVKQSGGFIFADSEVDRGTTFTLYFPSCERPVAAQAAPVAPPPEPMSDHKRDGVVLLVEDEAPVRAFASRALRLRGYSVLEAASAEAALALLSDPGLTVDIFVTDVIMPGKDGPTWVREALAQRPDTKVVFVSGYAEDAFPEHKALIPNSVFLPKPFSLTELTNTVQQQLH